jgi:hypothetical protein
MRNLGFVMVVGLFGLAVEASAQEGMEVWKEWRPEVEKATRAYIEKFSTPKERKKWNEWMDERCETRSLETVALDWFVDNEVKLREKDPQKIKEACFLLIRLIETNTAPPMQVRDRMTDENFRALVEFLSTEVGQGKQSPVIRTTKR